MINDELNRARNSAKREVNKMEDENERERLKQVLSQSKYALLKPEKSLTDRQKLKLEEVKKNFPILAKLHQQKEDFRNIFETASDWADGAIRLMDWMKNSKDTFKDGFGTIYRWFGEITAYFETRKASGSVERINNQL